VVAVSLVAWLFHRVQLSGYLAWLAWLGLHLLTLMGFRNRATVLINWVWNYFRYRPFRLILEVPQQPLTDAQPAATPVSASVLQPPPEPVPHSNGVVREPQTL
jgi:NADH dehydrogenase